MGVRGLTSYVNSIETLWKRQTKLKNTELVIDGCGLCNYLYKNVFDCRCGGQYEEFYNAVLSLFNVLDCNGVESFVVLDGAQHASGKKLETHKKRANQRIETACALAQNRAPENGEDFLLPLLSRLVFLQALRDLTRDHSVKFVVCDSEADTEIASLACAWNCPVLGNDSDFFIFDIKAGYIPLSSFNWTEADGLTADIFYREELASHFEIRAEFLPLFASLAGNDYVSYEALAEFGPTMNRGKASRFKSIANILSDSSTEEEALESALLNVGSAVSRVRLRQAVKHSLQEYKITESNLLNYFHNGVIDSSLKTQNGSEIEEWIFLKFRKGLFSAKCMSTLTTGKNFLRTQVENCLEVSANQCSQSLRQVLYGILDDAASHDIEGNLTMVQEWDREVLEVNSSRVPPNREGVVPGVSLIPRLEKEERIEILLNVLDSNTACIKSLPEKFKLIAASLRFFVNNAQPMLEMNHLVALLCCCLTLEDDSIERKENSTKSTFAIPPFDLGAAQSFCQWQCVLRDAIDLNFILCEPLTTPRVHKTFNGKLAHSLQEELNQGRTPEELLPSLRGRLFYKELHHAVTDGLQAKLFSDEGKKSFCFYLVVVLLLVVCCVRLSLLRA